MWNDNTVYGEIASTEKDCTIGQNGDGWIKGDNNDERRTRKTFALRKTGDGVY